MEVNNRQIEEMKRQAREANRRDKKRAEVFEAMVATEAWKEYSLLLSASIQQFGDQVLAPANGLDGAFSSEYTKGTIKGLLLAQSLPQATIETVKANKLPDDDGDE